MTITQGYSRKNIFRSTTDENRRRHVRDIYISKETGKVVGIMYEDVDYKLVPIKQEDEK